MCGSCSNRTVMSVFSRLKTNNSAQLRIMSLYFDMLVVTLHPWLKGNRGLWTSTSCLFMFMTFRIAALSKLIYHLFPLFHLTYYISQNIAIHYLINDQDLFKENKCPQKIKILKKNHLCRMRIQIFLV